MMDGHGMISDLKIEVVCNLDTSNACRLYTMLVHWGVISAFLVQGGNYFEGLQDDLLSY